MKRNVALLVIRAIIFASLQAVGQEMPELDHPWTDGLYSTITEPSCTANVRPKTAQVITINLLDRSASICAHAVIQKDNAPLVIILNGTFGQATGPEASLWMAWFEAAGYHCMSFDSTFLSSMNGVSNHGPAGNLDAEAGLSAQIIKAFLANEAIAGKVSKVGLVGMSYGATQALLLAKMSREHKLPFELSAVQAYCPPVSMAASLKILDDSWALDWDLAKSLWRFRKMQREYPVREQFDPRMMRAAIAWVFRCKLMNVVEANDAVFGSVLEAHGHTRLLSENADKMARLNIAGKIGFRAYLQNFAEPYWRAVGFNGDLLTAGELDKLLPSVGPEVETIVTENDPLNNPDALAHLQGGSPNGRLTILPRGGHLGFVNAKWTRAKLCGMFDSVVEIAASK